MNCSNTPERSLNDWKSIASRKRMACVSDERLEFLGAVQLPLGSRLNQEVVGVVIARLIILHFLLALSVK